MSSIVINQDGFAPLFGTKAVKKHQVFNLFGSDCLHAMESIVPIKVIWNGK